MSSVFCCFGSTTTELFSFEYRYRIIKKYLFADKPNYINILYNNLKFNYCGGNNFQPGSKELFLVSIKLSPFETGWRLSKTNADRHALCVSDEHVKMSHAVKTLHRFALLESKSGCCWRLGKFSLSSVSNTKDVINFVQLFHQFLCFVVWIEQKLETTYAFSSSLRQMGNRINTSKEVLLEFFLEFSPQECYTWETTLGQ